ncbi:MAG: sigma-70 family RNA polymerase sigma factor [Clostridia bacterium]|nr:sigma-70 family RNA polymerase sigma factor [Clostridia bacterium]
MAMEKERLVALVTKAQNGDTVATNELFNAYYNDLYYFALKTIKDDDLALDITQEAFVEIINTLGNLKEPAAFVTWAKQITYHQCTRYFRKKKDVLVDEDEEGNTVFDDLKEESAEFIPDEALDQSDFKKTILSLLDELSEEQRSAVMMYYFDEMSVAQIAEIQGVSDGTVKSRLNYARKAIKASVEEYEQKNNIKLHAIPFFPFLKWLFSSSQNSMPLASAKVVAEGVSAATGVAVTTTTVAVSGAAATTATVTAVGIGAKIAALPLVAKIAAGIVAAAIAVGGGATAIIMTSGNDNETRPADTQSIVSSTNDDQTQEEDKTSQDAELVLEGIIPEGCTYTLYDGTVLTAGQSFPENCTAGDHVAYGDYLYGYECIYMGFEEDAETDWVLWKDAFDSGDSGLIESDAFGAWSVMVNDRTKTSYGEVVSKINGKPIKTLYATYYFCENMTTAPKIPSTVTAMTASYYGCASLTTAPVIPSNVERMMITFRYCTALSGDVVINATLDKSLEWFYSQTFGETTQKINLTGATPEEDLILIAKASNNHNITVNGKAVNFDEVQTEVEVDNDGNNDSDDESYKEFFETEQNFVVPAGCTYTSVSGKVYSAGATVTSSPQKGDTFVTSDYTYKYNYYCRENPMDSSIVEWMDYDYMEGWGVRTNDQTKQRYAPLEKSINGAPIKALTCAFRDCVNMTVVPELPEGCVNYEMAFYNCSSLKSVEKIPNGAIDLYCAFSYCTSLKTTPYLPDGVDLLSFTFMGCTSLKTVVNLPDSVTAMAGTFSSCTNITSVPALPSKLENMNWTFMGCSSLITAPTIPATVKQFTAAFVSCKSLTGTIEINAILDESNLSCGGTCSLCKENNKICEECINCCKYSLCFRNTQLPITLVGKCSELAQMASTALDGNVIVG